MCVNYGGRAEIVDAITAISKAVKRKKLKPESITEKNISKYYTF
jgi:undecaprenyl diphosphate synthase